MPAATKSKTKQRTITGAEILVEALIKQGTRHIFAYPGGASMPLHQALRQHRESIRTILPRHEQGGGFAAQGVSRSSDQIGVCMTTSGPGATNLVTSIADAKLDSVPLIAITGQVPQMVIGSDAFQETPIVSVCQQITKHQYLITSDDPYDAESLERTLRTIPRIVKEAFSLESLSYDELMELSHWGAKVMHPAAVQPARENGVPVLIRNTLNREFEGTEVRERAPTTQGFPVRGIASINHVSLLRLEGIGLQGAPGTAERLFGALARERISVILITQASSERSICFAVEPGTLERAVEVSLIDWP